VDVFQDTMCMGGVRVRMQSSVSETLKRAKIEVTEADSLDDAVHLILCEIQHYLLHLFFSFVFNRQ